MAITELQAIQYNLQQIQDELPKVRESSIDPCDLDNRIRILAADLGMLTYQVAVLADRVYHFAGKA